MEDEKYVLAAAQRYVLPVSFLVDLLLPSIKSTGKETGKTHLCGLGCLLILYNVTVQKGYYNYILGCFSSVLTVHNSKIQYPGIIETRK